MAAPTLRLILSTALADLLVGRVSAYLDDRVAAADMTMCSLRRRDTDVVGFLTATTTVNHDLAWQLTYCHLSCTEGLLALSRRPRDQNRTADRQVSAKEVAQWAHYVSGSPAWRRFAMK
jgi:hypothetical protein